MIGRSVRALCASAFVACGSGADRAANDNGATRDSLRADTTRATLTFREWSAVAGRHLLVAIGSPDTALVVFPEFTSDSSLANVEFVLNDGMLVDYLLFAQDGSSIIARLTNLAAPRQQGCLGWPVGSLHAAAADTAIRAWTIGLRSGRARGIPYSSLDRHSGRDSADLVVDLTRLASQAPNDTTAALRGLPYVVQAAYTAVIADSRSFVFGELVRRVNMEANPHEERTTVIGERAAASTGVSYSLGFSERHTGDEESIPTTELIGLVELQDGTYLAFGARDYSDGGTFLMLERSNGSSWRLRWQSAYAGC